MKITHHNWSPDFPNKVEIESGDDRDMFSIVITQDSPDIEINFDWDHDWGGRGSATMDLPIDVLLSAIQENQVPVNDWISVEKEGHPKENKWYIVCTNHPTGHPRKVIEAFYDGGEEGLWLDPNGEMEEKEVVTHYREKPEPPKEEFRDKNGQTFDQWAEDNGCY